MNLETIATGRGIRELRRLQKAHGKGRGRKRKGLLGFSSLMAASTRRKSTGTRRTALAEEKPRSSASSRDGRLRFVVCVANEGYAASLETRKIYRAMPDTKAARLGLVRVVDESGEDYLYPKDNFELLELPARIARVLHA